MDHNMKDRNRGKKIIKINNPGAEDPLDRADIEDRIPSAFERGMQHAEDVDNEILRETVGKLEEEITSLTDELARERAKFQNLRRRTDEEKAEIRKFATYDLAFDLLNVLDCFGLGLECSVEGVDEALKPYIQGVQYTIDEMNKVLARHGILEIPTDIPYDPNLHQVFECVETDGCDEGEIIDVKRKGYMLHDRVLRTALVSVAGTPGACGGDEVRGGAE